MRDDLHRLLQDAIEHHAAVNQHRARKEREQFASLPLKMVVDRVTRGLDAWGEPNDHLTPWLHTKPWAAAFKQYHAKMTTPAMLETLAEVRKFRGVYEVLWENKVPCVNRVAVYDAAVGISAKRGFRPTRIYVHALPLKAAELLGLPVIDGHKIRKTEIPEEFGLGKWPAGDIEDILCDFYKRCEKAGLVASR